MQSFEMYSGDSKHLIIDLTEKGKVLDLAGTTITWKMKEQQKMFGIQKTLGSGIQITGEGQITVYMQPNDTKNKSGLYHHHVVVTDALGNESTVFKDTIYVKER